MPCPLFWVGLLYDVETQKQVAALIEDWTQAERDALRAQAPVQGLATPFRDGTLLDVGRQILALAEQGLKARACSDGAGGDETIFLRPLKDTLETGQTPAEKLLAKYHENGAKDVRPIFLN